MMGITRFGMVVGVVAGCALGLAVRADAQDLAATDDPMQDAAPDGSQDTSQDAAPDTSQATTEANAPTSVPPIGPRPGARTHNGFYLQLTAGVGYLSTTGDSLGADESLSSLALDTSLMLGGTIFPGFVLGGGFFIDYGPSPTAEINGMEFANGPSSQYLVGLGLFADFYPDPQGGLHFQGFVGWGGLERAFEGNVGSSDPTGLVVTLGGGYDVFVSDEVSLGGMLRIAYASLSMGNADYTSIAPALLGTLTYH